MAISFACPHCGQGYSVSEDKAGKKAKCKCGQVITVPVEERSAGGVPIIKNAPRAARGYPAATPYLAQIERHIERTIGPAPQVFHEIISAHAHVDLHIVPPQPGIGPSEARPMGGDYFTVVTSGLSAKPMNVSPPARKAGISPYAELMVALPRDWPGLKADGTWEAGSMKEESRWWPFRWIKQLARMPEEYNTFFAPLVTVPNGEDAAPFVPGTQLCCWMMIPPLLCPGAGKLVVSDEVAITFYAVMALTRDEMELKLRKGQNALVEAIGKGGLTELIESGRKSVLKKGLWPF